MDESWKWLLSEPKRDMIEAGTQWTYIHRYNLRSVGIIIARVDALEEGKKIMCVRGMSIMGKKNTTE